MDIKGRSYPVWGLLMQMYRKPKIEIQEMFIRWIHWPSANACDCIDDTLKNVLDCVKCIRESPTLNDTIVVFEKYLIAAVQNRNQEKRMSREVAEVVQFIKNNYEKEISLQQVAKKVGMSTNYFSSLFKKELGFSLVEYINFVRIEKAKELLLKHTHEDLRNIAEGWFYG